MVELANAPVPALERIDSTSFENLIRDPAKEQDVIDYAQFTGDTIVDTALAFAAKTRALVPKRRQIGMFFGYILELTTSIARGDDVAFRQFFEEYHPRLHHYLLVATHGNDSLAHFGA